MTFSSISLWLAASLLGSAQAFSTVSGSIAHTKGVSSSRLSRSQSSLCSPARRENLHGLRLAPQVFEPQAPDLIPTLISLGSIFGLAGYWWLVFVPGERRDLASNKNKGGLNEYLDILETDESRSAERWFYTEWLNRRRKVKALVSTKAQALSKTTGESVEEIEKRLMSDVAENNVERAKAMPKFFSLDNPLIIAAIVMTVGVFLSGSTGR